MLINDTKKDIKRLCIDNDVTQTTIAERTGTSKSYLSQILMRPHVDAWFVKIIEALGYDVKIEYVKREKL